MEAIGAIQEKGAKIPRPTLRSGRQANEGQARERLNSRPTCRSCHCSLNIWDFGPTDLTGRANKPLMIVAIARWYFGPMSCLVSLVSCASGDRGDQEPFWDAEAALHVGSGPNRGRLVCQSQRRIAKLRRGYIIALFVSRPD